MKKMLTFLGSVLKWIWNVISFTRQLLLNLLFIGAVVALYFVISSHFNPSTISAPPKQLKPKALLVDLSGPVVEKLSPLSPYEYATNNLLGSNQLVENLLFDVVDTIRAAAKDQNINGMVLNLIEMSDTSLTKLRYIAKAINEFKASGKHVVAIGGHYSQSQYYLASYADEVWMSPDGGVLLQGYGSYNLYFKNLLDKLEITTHVFRAGNYKSAVEPYTRSEMSEEAREANSVWLNQVWAAYVADVAANREIGIEVLSPTSESLLTAIKTVKGDFALLAKKLGLVDELLTRQQMRNKLAEQFGANDKDSFNYVSIYDYQDLSLTLPQANQIAVVVVDGAIIDGTDANGASGSDTIAELLRDAKLNPNVKAVVLRINSPGGSAFASEVIRNEVVALKQAGKPVVVSMSSVAASGGYWVASSADRIVAQPTTITGSIGVFGILTTFNQLLEKYGVNNDGIGTTPLSGIDLTRALPAEVGEILQLGVDNTYQRFLNLVADSRKLPLEEVDKVAQGRVWTGYDAMKYGLVDQMGDFDDAVAVAAELSKIDLYSLNWLKKPLSPLEELVYQLVNNLSVMMPNLESKLPAPFAALSKRAQQEISVLTQFNDPNGRYVLCPDCSYDTHP